MGSQLPIFLLKFTEGTKIKGTIFGGGLEKPGDAKKRKDLIKKAFDMGKNIC